MNRKEIVYPFTVTHICSAYDFHWAPDFRFDGERHNFWEIVCVLRGEVEATENEKVYTLRAHNLLCHAPGEFHRIRASGGTEPHVLILSFLHRGQMPPTLGAQ